MGSNYYYKQLACEECGHQDEPLHIGKSSAGWCFALRIYPEKGISTLKDWEDWWSLNPGLIVDEYGKAISVKAMLNVITNRPRIATRYTREWLKKNNARRGPRDLASDKCGTPGDGTYDLMDFDFS